MYNNIRWETLHIQNNHKLFSQDKNIICAFSSYLRCSLPHWNQAHWNQKRDLKQIVEIKIVE